MPKHTTTNVLNIPKKIWTFWNSSKLPPTVDNCIKTWRFLNPDYEIIVLNEKNINKWIPEFNVRKLKHAKDSYARLADFIRCQLLYKHGGIWLDSSIICTMPFDIWFDDIKRSRRTKARVEYVGFYLDWFTKDKRYPVIENWAFACPKHSKFFGKWKNEFMKINDYDEVDDYLDDVKELGVNFQHIEKDDPNYLAMHIAAQVILQHEKYPQKNLVLFRADDGPLKYKIHRAGKQSLEKRVNRLCKEYDNWMYIPMIKFTNDERNIMEHSKKVRDCVFNNWKDTIMTVISGIET